MLIVTGTAFFNKARIRSICFSKGDDYCIRDEIMSHTSTIRPGSRREAGSSVTVGALRASVFAVFIL